jgi:predicted alpha/beta hydrolase family esterase
VQKKYFFISDHDPYVATASSLKLAQQLDFPYHVLPNAGHFLAEDGFTTFPALVQKIKQWLVVPELPPKAQ